ncbi:MAG: hypothetical protein K2Q06_03435, partial [Parvularculaceae bacterium]|nr:hypothetical protein [Parvularculaceae bacterium]
MRLTKALKLALAAGVSAAPLFAIEQVLAQPTEPSASDEIIVSARRRDESLQDVPIAVTAFSGESLEQMGAADITALQDLAPNVTLEA